ncbi:amino acid adenylation domain-containing protein [Actinophytocola sp.]|uniref:amino acid adenylation domain-containing protein n=1 Tax=Actinophytocola sp. TaxID=1872138 RepID=UPI002ED3B727
MSTVSPVWCHAISSRLPGPVEPAVVAEHYAAIVRRAGMDVPATLWVERVPTAAARRRLAAELAVPAARGLRAVLLCGDDRVDLVLVADRAVVGRRGLDGLVAALTGGATPEPLWSRQAPARVTTAAPRWGLGGSAAGTGEFDLGPWADGSDPPTWLAALAVVLSRYEGGESALTAVLDTVTTRGTGPVEDMAARTLDDLVTRFRSPASTAAGQVAVGLVFDTDPPAAGEYRGWLALPFPLTIGIGRTRLRYEHEACIGGEIAAQFVRHLAEVHRQVVETPRLPVGDVELLDEGERQRVIALGGSAAPPEGGATRIHDVFAARVAERPDAVVLCHQRERLTYRELDELSDRLAGGLRRAGVGDGDRVGVCLDRSAHLVATMLAVLKAGAVYVPMDPSYPAERLAYMTADADLGVVVTTHEEFPTAARLRLVTPEELAALGDRAAPEPATTPADPAYVIYTSGSTGRPKGVVVTHANVIALLAATREDFGLGHDDVWTLFHSSAFDFSVWEIWGCLLTGGRLVVVPFWVSRSPEEFHDLLVDEQVTVLNQTPSAFTQLLEADRTRPPLAVRLVVFGGEPLDTRMLLPWFDRHPETECRVVNMFGITETTVHVTAGTITRREALAASRTVGRPLPGWRTHVLDPAGRLLPPGIPGEIHVGGAGVALGYLNRPELNAERFIADPFGGGRLYRSGDEGRLRPDGTLEHLGRIDNQVKVRGFRIELDEVRSVLLEDHAVRAAAVVLREGDRATTGIDAYVVLDGSSTDEVRERAGRILPDHMVPTTVTAVPSLPLTTNGKIDLRRLPPPKPPAKSTAGEREPPEDAFIQALLEVWRSVLGIPVDPDDDFFDLGGNSLLAVRIAAKSRERRLPAVPLRSLYRYPTIRALVEATRAHEAE